MDKTEHTHISIFVRKTKKNSTVNIILLLHRILKTNFKCIPSTPPTPSCLAPTLVAHFRNYHMTSSLPCVHIYLLSSDWERYLWLSKHIREASMCLCAFHLEISSFFSVRVYSFFLFLRHLGNKCWRRLQRDSNKSNKICFNFGFTC